MESEAKAKLGHKALLPGRCDGHNFAIAYTAQREVTKPCYRAGVTDYAIARPQGAGRHVTKPCYRAGVTDIHRAAHWLRLGVSQSPVTGQV